jgi:hypothetical protein
MNIATAVREFLEARAPEKRPTSSSRPERRPAGDTAGYARTLTLCARSSALRMELRDSIADALSAHMRMQ